MDEEDDDPVPLPNVSANILRKVYTGVWGAPLAGFRGRAPELRGVRGNTPDHFHEEDGDPLPSSAR